MRRIELQFSLIIGAVLFLSACSYSRPKPVDSSIFAKVTVRGGSLNPTLKSNQPVLVDLTGHGFLRADVVIFKIPRYRHRLVKKIVGVPGDKISLALRNNQWTVFINDQPVRSSEGALIDFGSHKSKLQNLILRSAGVIPAEKYFVVGDLRFATKDSSLYGFIHEEEILGKVISGKI